MRHCLRSGVVAGLALAALVLCDAVAATGEPPAPAPPSPAAPAAPSPAVQRDMEIVNRRLRERQQKQGGAPAQAGPAAPATSAPPASPPPPAGPAPSAAAIDTAVARLADESPEVRRAAERELKAAGAAAVPALIDALEGKEERVRISAVAVLGKTKDPRAVEPLSELLDTPSKPLWDALWDAFWSLRQSAAPALIDALDSNDDTVRWRAVALMGSSRDSRFTEPLIATLNKDPDTGVRVDIATTLGKIGDRLACEALLDALHDW